MEPAGYALGDLAAHATPSLFGEGTVLVLRGLEDAPDELLEDAKALVLAPEPDVVLVLRHRSGQRGKGLLDAAKKAGAAVHDCPKLTKDSEKTTFVQDEFRRAGRRIAPEAVAALVEAVGQDVRELAAACAQLMADTMPADGQARDAETVEVDVVHRYYGGRVEATGFRVADAAIERPDRPGARAAAARAGHRRWTPCRSSRCSRSGLRTLAKVAQRGFDAFGRRGQGPRRWRPGR